MGSASQAQTNGRLFPGNSVIRPEQGSSVQATGFRPRAHRATSGCQSIAVAQVDPFVGCP